LLASARDETHNRRSMSNANSNGGGLLQKLALVRREEWTAVLWSALYFFCVLASYGILRPMRELAGIKEGLDTLPILFTGTFIAMSVANPLFSALVSRFPRRKFIPIVYRFFALNLLAFFLLFRFAPQYAKAASWTFFIWLSVFNLFVVSVFRGFMADIWTEDQGKRLFGLIGIGGTLGIMAGAWIQTLDLKSIPAPFFLLFSLVMLEAAVQCMLHLSRLVARDVGRAERTRAGDQLVGGSVWSGIKLAFSSPKMIALSLLMLVASSSFTMLYFEQAQIVKAQFATDAAQKQAFARIDFWAQTLTLMLEVFLTGRIMRWFGLRVALVVLPLLAVIAFTTLHFWPVFGVLLVLQVTIRGTNYGLASPAREVLFTTMSREAKYRAKSLIDTFVWRSGDLLGIWIKPLLSRIGVALAVVAVPLGLVWTAVAWWLGNRHEKERAASVARAIEADRA
jgi:AAA family ATP:ADP antiporter